ncbi:MAG TPA: MFS transporter [Pyrinomonadaceae bacterium]|nr:MFS transporter [Chloracidobacterium sp.]MBP9934322.1 MFS transporter [Pyrinomonadaceae bacterium]MBK9436800.1 MFS transporter [Chloracidobacterium sp.]MBK9766449.1 MFS transporter [Chloracidobacterium sp.]MBL0241792.1 MFS transporter [Chloracidobacterium sp.]
MDQQPSNDPTAAASSEKFVTTPLVIIFITIFIDLIGFGMVIPLLPYYAETAPFNATPFEIGMLFSVYSWMQFFFSPILGRLSDRYGRRPILFMSLMGSAVGYFVLGIAGTLTVVFVGRILGGITGGSISTAQAYIADVTSKENRAKGMGLFGAAFGLGFILGPAIAGILSKYGVQVPFFFAAALSLCNAIALLFILPESVKFDAARVIKKSKNRFVEIFESFGENKFGLINLIYFLLVTAFSIMTYAFVLFTMFRFHFDAEQNGYLFAYVGLISIVGQGFLFGRFVKKFGESRLVAFGCVTMALSLVAFPFIGPEFGGLGLLLVVTSFLSLGNAMASPALTSLASKISAENEQGKALGILQSGASLARAIGPTIGGVLLNNSVNQIDNSTLIRTFGTASAIMFVAFIAALYFTKFVRPEPAV